MKTPLLLALLLGLTYFYFQHPDSLKTENQAPSPRPILATQTVIVAAPSYDDRWKTGPNAQTDLKTGPNAQNDFAPFAPSEQANWNQTPGYTIVSAHNARIR